MRAFVIADASKRKARPIGMLFWEPDPRNEQGRFTIELSLVADADTLPLSLSFCAKKKGRRATPKESEAWVQSRIVPEGRQNIADVLRSNGLTWYDEVALLAASKGRSSDDDYLVHEVNLPHRPASAAVDDLLSHVMRKGYGPEVRYAFVELPENEPAVPPSSMHASAAHRIGAAIRAHRLEAGLTQKQLAARAGITQTVLSRVETGNGNPTLGLLEDLAAALDTTLGISLDIR